MPSISHWVASAISQIEYTYNLYFHVVDAGCCCCRCFAFFSFHFRLQSSPILYCLNNIYYGYWSKIQFIYNTHKQYGQEESKKMWNVMLGLLSIAAPIFFVPMICFAVFNGTSFIPLQKCQLLFFCALAQFHKFRTPSRALVPFYLLQLCGWYCCLFPAFTAATTINRNFILFIRLEVIHLFMIALPSPIAVHNHKSCKLSMWVCAVHCVFICLFAFCWENRD